MGSMNDVPLVPFQPPHFNILIPAGVSPASIVTWGLYIVFAFWAIYSLVAIYHWLKYSNASWLAFPAIALHLFVSICLMSYGLSGDTSLVQYVLHLVPTTSNINL
jgi:hypothetical protein